MPMPMLTDSGSETWLVFHRGADSPDFAAFPTVSIAIQWRSCGASRLGADSAAI